MTFNKHFIPSPAVMAGFATAFTPHFFAPPGNISRLNPALGDKEKASGGVAAPALPWIDMMTGERFTCYNDVLTGRLNS